MILFYYQGMEDKNETRYMAIANYKCNKRLRKYFNLFKNIFKRNKL